MSQGPYKTRYRVGAYGFPIKAASRAMTYFHDRGESNLVVLGNAQDAIQAADYAITDSFVGIGRNDCILFLCDGGVSKAIESKTTYGGTFLKWRYVLNLSGKLLNKLGARKKWITANDIASPLIVSATTHISKQAKRKLVDLSGGKIQTLVLGQKREFRVKRCVLYSRYLFMRSPMYKLFMLGELRRGGIPVTCVCTDGDSTSIQMLKGSLKTENIFGFTNDTVNRLAKETRTSLPPEYRMFKLEDSKSIPSLYANIDKSIAEAKIAISKGRIALEPTDLYSKTKDMLIQTIRGYNEIRSCSLPPNYVKQFSNKLGELRGYTQSLPVIAEEAIVAEAENIYRAASSLKSALDILMTQILSEDKLSAIKLFVGDNPKVRIIPWTRYEGEALSSALGLDITHPVSDVDDDLVLFGGLRSTWQMLEAIRHARPSRVKLIGWDVEAQEYDSFKQRYSQASNELYDYDKNLALRISAESSPRKL